MANLRHPSHINPTPRPGSMWAITIKQPMAQLIALGLADAITRHWPMPPGFTDQRVILHAAKGPMEISDIQDLLRRIEARDPLVHPAAKPFLEKTLFFEGKTHPIEVDTSVFVGAAIFGRCEAAGSGSFHWYLTEGRVLPRPLSARGAPGIWPCYSKPIQAAIHAIFEEPKAAHDDVSRGSEAEKPCDQNTSPAP